MPTLEAELAIQIDAALASLGELDDALAASASNFSDAINEAVQSVSATTVEIPVEADTAPAQGAIDDVVAGADQQEATVTVDADTAAAIESAEAALAEIEGTSATIDVQADLESAKEDVLGLIGEIDGTTATVDVEADTTGLQEAQSEIDGLNESVTRTGEAASGASGDVDVLSGATGGLALGMKAAKGSVEGTAGGLSGMLGPLAGVGAGFLAVGAATATFFEVGERAEAAMQRLDLVFGDFADQAQQIDIGGLSGDLADLALQSGSSAAKLRQATASLGTVAVASGLTQKAAAGIVGQFQALALRAVALNPSLGEAGDVMNRLSTALARGGRFAQQFGLSLAPGAIQAEALRENVGKSAAELTIFDKAMAGATLATKGLGDQLGADFQKGIEQSAVKFKALRAEITAGLAKVGIPLVQPILELAEAFTPLAVAIGGAVGALVKGFVPGMAAAAKVAAPLTDAFEAIGEALDFLEPIITPLTAAFVTFEVVTRVVPLALGGVVSGLIRIVESAPLTVAAIESTTLAIEGAEIGIATALPVIGLIAGALAIGATAFGIFGESSDESSKQVDSFTDAVTKANGVLDDSALQAARSLFEERNQIDDLRRAHVSFRTVVDSASRSTKGQADLLGQLTVVTGKAAFANKQLESATGATALATSNSKSAVAGLRAEQEKLIAKIREGNPVLANQISILLQSQPGNFGIIQTIAELAKGAVSATQKVKDLAAANAIGNAVQTSQADLVGASTEALRQYAAGNISAKDALDALNASQDEANNALSLYKQTLEGLLGLQGNVTAAQISFNDAQAGAVEALIKNGTQFDINTQAGRDNVKALQQQTQAAVDLAAATFQSELASKGQATAQADANQVLSNFAAQTEASLTGLGLSKEAVDALLTSLGLFPAFAPPTVESMQSIQDAVNAAASFGFVPAADAVDKAGAKIATDTDKHLGDASKSTKDKGAEIAAEAGAAADKAQAQFEEQLQKLPEIVNRATTDAVTTLALSGALLAGVAVAAGVGVGRSFSSGIAVGIAQGSGAVQSAASQVVSDAESAARSRAKSKSPSQLFAALGRDMGSGLAIGLTDSAAEVAAASTAMIVAAAVAVQRQAAKSNARVAVAVGASGGASPAAAAASDARRVGTGPLFRDLVVAPTHEDPVAIGLETGKRVESAVFRNTW